MAFVTGYDNDIFISYAQVDNTPMNCGGKDFPWVSYFKEQLQMRVEQELGIKNGTKIWMDLQDLGGNQGVTPTIATAIRNTATLVVMLSKGYMVSHWCGEEFQSFIKTAKGEDRLFVVHLADIPREKRPEGIRDLIGFNFFDPTASLQLDPGNPVFSTSMGKLRSKIAEKLLQMAADKKSNKMTEVAIPTPSTEKDTAPAKPAVLVAEGHDDLDEQRDAIITFVEKLGYRVLPARLYPRGAAEFQKALIEDLSQCQLFIQPLGQNGTRRTPDLPDGYEGLQWEQAKAMKILALRAFERGAVNMETVKNDSHRAFLKANDVMALDPEEFKMEIKDRLEKLARMAAKPTGPEDRPPVLIHGQKAEFDAMNKFRDWLRAGKIRSEILLETESIEHLSERAYAGQVIVYGANSDGTWMKERVKALRPVLLEKKKPESVGVLYFDPPEYRDRILIDPIPEFLSTIDSKSPASEFQKIVEEFKARADLV